MRLFIAEKPSIARSIAGVLSKTSGGKPQKDTSSIQVGNDRITWLFGHVYEQASPEAYGFSTFPGDLKELPVVPAHFELQPRDDNGVRKHIKAVNKLIHQADKIVNAGDAGREGQLLVDEVIEQAGKNPFDGNVLRLWASSQTDKDVKAALDGLFPNKDKKPLSEAAVCRQKADYIHGMSWTRYYTKRARDESGLSSVVSVGRVQTPTLRMVVDRDRTIENFQPKTYYIPRITARHANGNFEAAWSPPEGAKGFDEAGRLVDKNVADVVAGRADGQQGRIRGVDSQEKTEQPPLPYSLSSFQAEASSKLGLTAKKALQHAQSLYEKHKVATYPRTDSPYLPVSLLQDEAPTILDNLSNESAFAAAVSGADRSLKSPAWNDEKTTDHHGIVPTVEATPDRLQQLDPMERKVFDLIATRFIAQFYPPARHMAMTAYIDVGQDTFRARGRRDLDRGWKRLYDADKGGDDDGDDDENDDNQALPKMADGDDARVTGTRVDSRQTKPPKRFTDGTLISAMSNPGPFVSDPAIRKRLRENDGLGTVATRADTIEVLVKRGYVERNPKRQIVSTQFGRDLIDNVLDDIADPGMTALWEGTLAEVSEGNHGADQFMQIQDKLIRQRLQKAHQKPVKLTDPKGPPLSEDGKTCPRCGKGQLKTRTARHGQRKGQKFLGCTNFDRNDPENSCRYSEWPDEGSNNKRNAARKQKAKAAKA